MMNKPAGKLPARILNVLRKGALEERKRKGSQKCQKGDPGGKGKEKKGPETNATQSVIDFAPPRSLDREIYVLRGTTLRRLRGGLGLCSPCILEPAYRVFRAIWNPIRSLLSVCNKDILTSEAIRSTDLLNVLNKTLLDNGVQNLGGCLSEFPRGEIAAVVKKPQCLRLEFAKCLEELDNGADSKFLGNVENGAAAGYMFYLGNFPETHPRQNKTTSIRRETTVSR